MKKQLSYLKIRAILFLALVSLSITQLQARWIANEVGIKSESRASGIVFLDSTNAPEINTLPEHIFSGLRGTTSPTRNIVISNTGVGALQVSGLSITGTNASAFGFINPPATPFSIPAGSSRTIGLVFKPAAPGGLGALTAILNINNNDPDEGALKVGLFGLSAKAEQGNNEPTFDAIVKTLGYNINVGGTGLILPTTPAAIGDEVLTPLFKKAGTGNVTMKPVARYSPDDFLDYGYYTKANGAPVVKKIGQVTLDQEQKLLPEIVSGSATTFDPGNDVFGFYTGATSYANQPTFTEDAFNTGPLDHSARIYPLKNRVGQLIPNSYLVAFEPASNGDYQDYVFTVSNVVPATSNPQSQLLEAEKAGIFRALVKTGNKGFSGTGYVDYVNNSLDYIQWTFTNVGGGATPIQFRHASGSANRALRLIVNGTTVVPSLNFPATGGWAKWALVNATVNLLAGTNTIKLEANGSSVPNIDYLLVNPGSNRRINFEEEALDLSENKLDAIISPNPCFGETQISISTSSDLNITIEVKDLLGKSYQVHQTKTHELSLKGLDKGLYIIQVKQGDKVTTTRLVVE